MATGLASAVANGFLDAIGNAANYTAPTVSAMKLHVGDPGAAGTSNAATETTRKSISFAAASGGAISSDAAATWTNVAGSEDYTHFSIHNHISSNDFICSGTITANAVVAGDTFTIASGDVDLTLSTAA